MRKDLSHFSDVLVVGSGPAGVASAISCVQAGLAVTLITSYENSVFLFGKEDIDQVESVHSGLSSLLDVIGAKGALSFAAKGKYKAIKTANKYNKLNPTGDEDWYGYHIDRKLFDSFMLDCAEKKSVNVIKGLKVTEIIENNGRVVGVKTIEGKVFKSYFIIDATGRKRFFGKRLHFKELQLSPSLISWSGIVQGATDSNFEAEIAHFIPNAHGWIWLAPFSNDCCVWTQLTISGSNNLSPPLEVKHYAKSSHIRTANMRWRIFRPLVKDGLFLTGDAAGIIDPAAGQGILNALLSGLKASQTIIKSLNNPTLESFYMSDYDSWLLNRFEINCERLYNHYQNLGIRIF